MPQPPHTLQVAEFRDLGLLCEVNRLLLHPLGLAMYVDEVNNRIGVYDMRGDEEGVFYDDVVLAVAAEKVSAVASLIEARGPARIEELGYVVQPLPPEVKQLKVTVLEHTDLRIGGPGELDEGEELELTVDPAAGVVVTGELLP